MAVSGSPTCFSLGFSTFVSAYFFVPCLVSCCKQRRRHGALLDFLFGKLHCDAYYGSCCGPVGNNALGKVKLENWAGANVLLCQQVSAMTRNGMRAILGDHLGCESRCCPDVTFVGISTKNTNTDNKRIQGDCTRLFFRYKCLGTCWSRQKSGSSLCYI